MLECKRSEALQLFRRSFHWSPELCKRRLRQRLHTGAESSSCSRKTHFVTNLTATLRRLSRLTIWRQATRRLVKRLPKGKVMNPEFNASQFTILGGSK